MVDFYGVINDILELRYVGWQSVGLFRCNWFDVNDVRLGIHIFDHFTSCSMCLAHGIKMSHWLRRAKVHKFSTLETLT